MSDLAISAHGTIIARQATPGGVFTNIGEVGDFTPPALSRNEIDVSTHNDDIDTYVAGILRRGSLTFPINFVAGDSQHDEATGLLKHLIDNTKTGYRVTFPDGDIWIFSGYVTNMAPQTPVDGALRYDVTIRPSGPMKINAVTVS